MATSAKVIETTKTEESKKKRLRSPAYPFIDLETASQTCEDFLR